MLVDDEFRKRVDRMLFGGNPALEGVPRLGGVLPASGGVSDGGGEQPYEVALNRFQKGLIVNGMRATGADEGFDRTINRMTNGAFTPEQIKSLEDRSLNKASWDEAMTLRGISEGPPVVLDRNQKAVVDSLMDRLGSDPLATNARGAYQGSLHAGHIRVR